MLGVFIGYPALALVPVALLLLLYRASRRSVVLLAALAWLLYGAYELAMKHRVWCSGECNIRVDLLLIYPALAILTLVAAYAGLRVVWGRH